MNKIMFVLGAGIGFVLGSKAGNGPYQQIEAQMREVIKRPNPKPQSGGRAVPSGPFIETDDAAADIVPMPDSHSTGDAPVEAHTPSTTEGSGTLI